VKIVLHICCGVCAAGVVDRLTREGHQVLGFFYNPNIHPPEEYERRLAVARRVAEEFVFPLEVAPYTPEEWFVATRSLEDEPEGGKRCAVCFRLRLNRTCDFLGSSGADAFTTTLTISPRKSAALVNKIGQEIGREKFLARDFKKQAGFQRAMELAKQWELYRQNYCGCIYSLRKPAKPAPRSQAG
jgi:predicted adenine nucleotide alpha hydrolase (AANH) superfamily ATPase